MNRLITHPAYFPRPPLMVALADSLIYENDKYRIEVGKGYRSDGGSLPAFSWSILRISPYDVRCIYAFILHDYCYQSHQISRAEADAVLNDVLAIPPACNALQRWLIYIHVRLYGWLPYNAKTAEMQAEGRKFGRVILKTSKYELF